LVQKCPYIPSFDVVEILSGDTDPHAALMIKDRIVFYGADIIGAADSVETPTHGRLPAVFVHAMALDNLMSMRGEYYRDGLFILGNKSDGTIFPFLIKLCVFSSITYLVLVYWGIIYKKYGDRESISNKNYLIFGALLFLLFSIILYIVVFVFVQYQRYLPFDWMGLLTLFSALEFFFGKIDPVDSLLSFFRRIDAHESGA
jgi:hypothetical protein